MVSWIGFPQTAVRFHRHARRTGETKYPLRTMLKLAMSGFTSFSFVPLRMATWLGFGIAAFAVLYVVLRAVLALSGAVGFGSAALVSSVFFLAGVQLLAIGALGEYIARVFEEATDRPLYLIKEWTDDTDRVIPPGRGEDRRA
jgi:dolichol-phosphate mannosyltransferase